MKAPFTFHQNLIKNNAERIKEQRNANTCAYIPKTLEINSISFYYQSVICFPSWSYSFSPYFVAIDI